MTATLERPAGLQRTATPGVYRDPDTGRIAYTWRDRGGVQRWGTADTVTEASQERDRKRRLKAGATARLDRHSRTWIKGYRGRAHDQIDDGTLKTYARDLTRCVQVLGPRKLLCDIQTHDVARVAKHFADQGLARATVKRIVAPLRAMLADAAEDGLIPVNPAIGVKVRTKRRVVEAGDERVQVLLAPQLRAVLDGTPERWKDLHELLAETGLRIAEALALQWQDLELDVDEPQLSVRRCVTSTGTIGPPKTDNGRRTIPISDQLAERMRARRDRLAERGPVDPSWFVFPRRLDRPDEHLDPSTITRSTMHVACAAAGLPQLGHHVLRHTVASRLIAAGRTPLQVCRWLGHHNAAYTLKTYGHLMDEGVGAALPVAA